MSDEPKLGKSRGNAGQGRRKGSQNKMTKALKDMILTALDEAHEDGGVAYLKAQASQNPTAFLSLVGRVLPLQVAGEMDHKVKISGALAWKPAQ